MSVWSTYPTYPPARWRINGQRQWRVMLTWPWGERSPTGWTTRDHVDTYLASSALVRHERGMYPPTVSLEWRLVDDLPSVPREVHREPFNTWSYEL